MTELFNKLDAGLKDEIYSLIKNGHLPHAVILEGKDRTVLDIVTDILVQYSVCLSNDQKPCGVCKGCFKAEKHIHPDVYTLTGSGTGNKIRVNDIRELCSDTITLPNEALCKVYVVNDCHLMNEQAQNAFLKSLEEPRQDTLFILKCETASSLLDTIRSRCTLIRVSCDGAELNEMGIKAHDIANEVVNALCGKSEMLLLKALMLPENDRELSCAVMTELKAVMTAVLSGTSMQNNQEVYTKLKNTMNDKKIYNAIKIVEKAENAVRHNANMNLLSAWTSASLRELRSN